MGQVIAADYFRDGISLEARHADKSCSAGKSTLLQILAGQNMVGPEDVLVLGRSAFHDVVCILPLSYHGTPWSGHPVPKDPLQTTLSNSELTLNEKMCFMAETDIIRRIELPWRTMA